jgi:hypothetical protein
MTRVPLCMMTHSTLLPSRLLFRLELALLQREPQGLSCCTPIVRGE